MYSWGLISGLEDQRVEDVDADVLVLVFVFVLAMEERVTGFDGVVDVGDVMVMSIDGRVLIDQDWSSLSRSCRMWLARHVHVHMLWYGGR